MPKWIKFIIGLLLLPVCLATALSLWQAFAVYARSDTVWFPMLAGAGAWICVFLLLPKPMWIYVFGHELTHAIWTWIYGGEVKRFKASANGGYVVTNKTNFVIALSPYFFPLYAVLVVLVYVIGSLIFNWHRYHPWFHFLLGAAYAFHITLTMEILKTRQTDITSQGRLFSIVIIFLGNALVLIIGLPLLTGSGLLTPLDGWVHNNLHVLHRFARLF